MRQLIILSSLFLIANFISCERSLDEKREKIEANELQNSAFKKEIKADSLKNKAKELEDQAKRLEKEADRLRDSARSM